jgi:hypothetical protein
MNENILLFTLYHACPKVIYTSSCTNDLHNLHKSDNENYIHKSRSNDFGHLTVNVLYLTL